MAEAALLFRHQPQRRVQELPARTLARNLQVLPGLVTWLANYRSLFSARCHICRKILVRPPPLRRRLKLALSESHIFKTVVFQELCPSNGRSRHIAADGRRSCEGARRRQAFSSAPRPGIACPPPRMFMVLKSSVGGALPREAGTTTKASRLAHTRAQPGREPWSGRAVPRS